MRVVRSTSPRFPSARVTITAKGQISIPTRLRDALGIVPGSRVVIDLIDDGFMLRRLTDREHGNRGAVRHRARKAVGRA